jgi:hypothetical protein
MSRILNRVYTCPFLKTMVIRLTGTEKHVRLKKKSWGTPLMNIAAANSTTFMTTKDPKPTKNFFVQLFCQSLQVKKISAASYRLKIYILPGSALLLEDRTLQ